MKAIRFVNEFVGWVACRDIHYRGNSSWTNKYRNSPKVRAYTDHPKDYWKEYLLTGYPPIPNYSNTNESRWTRGSQPKYTMIKINSKMPIVPHDIEIDLEYGAGHFKNSVIRANMKCDPIDPNKLSVAEKFDIVVQNGKHIATLFDCMVLSYDPHKSILMVEAGDYETKTLKCSHCLCYPGGPASVQCPRGTHALDEYACDNISLCGDFNL